MRAVGFIMPGGPETLTDLELPNPTPGARDLLVEVHAVSVNPVDTKLRASAHPKGPNRVLGFDAAGTVRATGAEVTLFAPGDQVFYAGALDRPGSNARLHIVDERIVGPKPSTLTDEEAAAVPLTAITAWELLFDRLGVQRQGGRGKRILILGAAGGVGSMLTQLASQLTDLEVIASASRPDSKEWVKSLGAHAVVDHRRLNEELQSVGEVDYVASLTGTEHNVGAIATAISPQGKVGIIDDPAKLDIVPFKRKSVSVHWELMFTRSLYGTADLAQQHHLLAELARLIDQGVLKTTLSQVLSPIKAETLTEAHRRVEAGGVPGKLVVSGWH